MRTSLNINISTGPPDHAAAAVAAVQGFITDNQSDLGVDVAELFDSGSVRAVSHGDGDSVQMSLPRMFQGLRVVGSRAAATVKKGNLIGISLEKWSTISDNFNTEPKISAADASAAVAAYAGYDLAKGESCEPELVILTLANGANPPAGRNPFHLRHLAPIEVGAGYKHALAWKVCPTLEGQGRENLEAYVEAGNGSKKVYSFKDANDYFEAKGDVFPTSNDGQSPDGVMQEGWPMPFLTVGTETTTTGGTYLQAPTSPVTDLYGPYVNMNDNCAGSVSLDHNAQGLDFGGLAAGPGSTDCDTPGFGGGDNTHSSRSGFYELNKIMEIARAQLPTNTWLQGRLTSNMNIQNTCNAYWNGQINFYRSGGGCGNTGEIAAIFDHEWGHGMDANDVNGGIANPSGEGIADIFAALRLNDSCIGRGFRTNGVVCSTGNNVCVGGCTGVRDIDYTKKERSLPSTLTWALGACSGGVHCLGYVYSEAVWELYTVDLPAFYNMDQNTALELTQRLTFIGSGNVDTWYTNTANAVPWGGCGASSGYKEYLLADDDDGNLTNGTPHMQAIYEAFNRHEIACNDLTVQDSGCAGTASLTAPTLTVEGAGNGSVQLSWTDVGAAAYQVFRTEGVWECAQGKVLLATTSGLSYSDDSGLQNGRQYYYIVIPKGSAEPSSSCFGPSSTCTTAIPGASPTISPVPTSSSVPTDAPSFSLAPSDSPTAKPTPAPTIVLPVEPTITATFDGTCAKCDTVGGACTSGPDLLNSRGTMTIAEPNQSNTIDNCSDGNSGSYHNDESCDAIEVSAVAGGLLQVGRWAVVKATVWAWSTGSSDTADFYVTDNVNNPNWVHIDSIVPPSGGLHVLTSKSFELKSTLQAVRVNFRYNGSQSHCTTGGYDDRDDLVFAVAPSGPVTPQPTGSPTTSPPTKVPTNSPSKEPTNSPSKKPSASPTLPSPTKSPTDAPTNSPSKKPTSAPTKSPTTPSPTKSPTDAPTNSPSKKPTSAPTESPTTPPPTKFPTEAPTNAPSKKPTSAPTESPTTPPPTSTPTKKPTDSPTAACVPDGEFLSNPGCPAGGKDSRCCSGDCFTGGGPKRDSCKAQN